MTHRRIAVGISAGTQPPIRQIGVMAKAARALRLDSLWVVDHFLGFIPQTLWDKDFSWLAKITIRIGLVIPSHWIRQWR